MKECVKAMLYAYALLDTVSEDYEEHIRNKAILSCLRTEPARVLAEKIALEILEKRVLETFKGRVESILSSLTETERSLVAIRYFGKERKTKERLVAPQKDGGWGERKYFREQAKLLAKLCERFYSAGLTKEYFETELMQIDIFEKVFRALRKRLQKRVSLRRKARFSADG